MYATRHDPFVHFHSIIDKQQLCDRHVVNLSLLPGDLARVSSTPNYTFITPNPCDDGHDAPCADGEPGDLAQINAWLMQWVPKITGSQAFREDGLLIITFDEAATSDTSSCCGEIADPSGAQPGETGPGGGDVGAVLLSPCIAPGTVTQTLYNDYTMLGSVENLFGLLHLSLSWRVSTKGGTPLAYSVLQMRVRGGWRTIFRHTHRTRYAFTGRSGVTYRFRVRAVNTAGQASRWSPSTLGAVA